MRLIDADKLIDNLDKMILADDGGDYAMGIVTAIQEAGRMAYEDYIKVIPVEWIEEYIKKLVIKRRFLAENGYRDNRCYDYMFGIIGMLDDWEKENDKGSE